MKKLLKILWRIVWFLPGLVLRPIYRLFTVIVLKDKFKAVMGILFVLMGLVLVKLAYVQLVHGTAYEQEAYRQLQRDRLLHSPRGRIVDRNGEELAVSIMTGALIANPAKMYDTDSSVIKKFGKRDVRRIAADHLAPILKQNADELYKDFSDTDCQYLRLARTMEPQTMAQVKQVIKEYQLPGSGLYFEDESKRYYTKKRTAAQIIGYVGDDDKGLGGIEYMYDKELKSRQAPYSILVDVAGKKILGNDAEEKPEAEKLSTVYLTLDSKIQYVLEDAMDDAMARTKAKAATAIIMDPYTGEILGMASRPTFNPNAYYKYSGDSFQNRAIGFTYEPGSVFKPIVGCMGLTEGVITPNTPFQDLGSIKIADRTIHNWDSQGLGTVPFSTVIKFSINTGMVQLGMKLGAERMTSYAKKFGFGEPTGIDLPGEESGILYNPKDMYEPDIATMAIGQGISVTPLQVLRAICAIANGGELLQPYIVSKIVAADGSIIKEGKKHVVRNVITPEVARQMREMMEKVVSEGGGKPAAIKGYRIAGKTGTAEKIADGGGYAAGQYIASFVGFVPADKPRYAMLVMLDTPQGAFYGSQVSAPIFRDTLQQILVAKGIQPSSSEGLPSFEEMNAVGSKRKKPQETPVLKVMPDGKIKLPDFKGTDMRVTADLLQQSHLLLKPYGSGTAYQQRPPAGSEVAENSTVEVWFN